MNMIYIPIRTYPDLYAFVRRGQNLFHLGSIVIQMFLKETPLLDWKLIRSGLHRLSLTCQEPHFPCSKKQDLMSNHVMLLVTSRV